MKCNIFCFFSICISCYSALFFDTREKTNEDFRLDSFSKYVDSEEVYSVGKVYQDIGINPENTYDGTGIKIGIVETNLPDYFPTGMNPTLVVNSFDYSHDNFFGSKEHAYDMCSILAGPRGIARGATYYFAVSSPNQDKSQCISRLVNECGVNIISCSNGKHRNDNEIGFYTSDYSFMMDNLSNLNNVLFVNGIGNLEKTSYKIEESLGLNVIGAGACNRNLEASSTVNANSIRSIYDSDFFTSPTLLAPGEKVFGFREEDRDYYDSNFGPGDRLYDYNSMSGTSTATPIVAGIAALLMQEFSSLKNDVRKLVSLICNTCEKATNQTSSYDTTNGFGIINYANAQKAANNTANFETYPSNVDGTLLYNINVNVPTNSKISVTTVNFLKDIVEQRNNEPETYIEQEDILFSQCSIVIKNSGNSIVASSSSFSNFSKIEFTNDTQTQSFTIWVTQLGDSPCAYSETFSLNYSIKSVVVDSLSIVGNQYLDICPMFDFSFSGISTNNFFQVVFYNMFNETILFKNLSNYSGSFYLSHSEWSSIVSVRGKEYYAYLKSWKTSLNIDYDVSFSKTFNLMEPHSFFSSAQILPSDWGFAGAYYFDERASNNIVKNNLVVTPKRLRCGYIENIYVNLSPRRIGAGHAYLELTFNVPVYHIMIGVTLWRFGELSSGRINDYALIKTKDSIGVWTEQLDLLNDIELPMFRKQIDRYEFNGVFYGLLIDVGSDAFGTTNNGRLCLDDIVLNCQENNFGGFGTRFYEPVVQNNTFIVD